MINGRYYLYDGELNLYNWFEFEPNGWLKSSYPKDIRGTYKLHDGQISLYDETDTVMFCGTEEDGVLTLRISDELNVVFCKEDSSIPAKLQQEVIYRFKFNFLKFKVVIQGIKDKSVHEIVIPNGVANIGPGAFSDCTLFPFMPFGTVIVVFLQFAYHSPLRDIHERMKV